MIFWITFKRPVFFFLMVILSACQKEDYTLPSDVTISFEALSDGALGGNLSFTDSELKIETIRLVGKRTVSNDIDFVKSSPFSVPPNLFDGSLPSVSVNIPQGIYDRFDLHLYIGQGTGNYTDVNILIDEWIDELNDYQEDANDDSNDGVGDDDLIELQEDLGILASRYRNDINPGLRMEGSVLLNGLPVSIIFAVDDALSLHLPVLSASGSRELSFEADKANRISVKFDPEFWFSPLSDQVLKTSWIGIYAGQNFLFIHKKINPQLYAILLSRLGDSFKTSKSD